MRRILTSTDILPSFDSPARTECPDTHAYIYIHLHTDHTHLHHVMTLQFTAPQTPSWFRGGPPGNEKEGGEGKGGEGGEGTGRGGGSPGMPKSRVGKPTQCRQYLHTMLVSHSSTQLTSSVQLATTDYNSHHTSYPCTTILVALFMEKNHPVFQEFLGFFWDQSLFQ